MTSIKAAKGAGVQISVIGLSAEVYICREMTQARSAFVSKYSCSENNGWVPDCRRIASKSVGSLLLFQLQMTGGRHSVALNEGHLLDLVMEHAVPPPMAPGSKAFSLVKMGFPGRASQAPGAATFAGKFSYGDESRVCLVQAG